MRDAIGGTVTITIIIFFILLVNGYLAFNVNYTKAFKVKSQIISIIEQNEGHTSKAKEAIEDYINDMNYSVNTSFLTSVTSADNTYYCNSTFGYCVKSISVEEDEAAQYRGTYYHVITFVNIDIPILNQLLPAIASNIFQVEGETKLVNSFGTNSELSY